MKLGKQTLKVLHIVEDHPGCHIAHVTRALGGSKQCGNRTAWRAIDHGIVRAVEDPMRKGYWRLYPAKEEA